MARAGTSIDQKLAGVAVTNGRAATATPSPPIRLPYPALVAQTVSNPAVLRQYDALAVTLAQAGFRPRSIVLSVSMLDTLCLGAALDVGAPSIVWDQPGDRESVLHKAIGSAAFDGDRSEVAFALQLEWIIQGMSRMLATDLDRVDA